MRAFRPSRFGRQDEVDEDVERAKQENVRMYSQRAQEGLPLFDRAASMPDMKSPTLSGHR